MRKFISLLLVLIICFSLFTACTEPPKPSLSPEELEKLEMQKYFDKGKNIATNGKNYRGYDIIQNTENQLFYIHDIFDVSQDKVRHFSYFGKNQTVGFGDTVDENGTRCFSSIQAILDMGLFSVKVEDSFTPRFNFDTARYSYTWGDNKIDGLTVTKPERFEWLMEFRDIVEFSELLLIDRAKSEFNGIISYRILTHIGKVPDFDVSEIGYVETSDPNNFKENIEKVTIIPDPNLGK